jgi:hypothetical protein
VRLHTTGNAAPVLSSRSTRPRNSSSKTGTGAIVAGLAGHDRPPFFSRPPCPVCPRRRLEVPPHALTYRSGP